MSGPADDPADDRSAGLLARLAVRRPTLELELDLAVAPGEVLALLGPNGAGKSTALHALAGLVPLDDGRVVLGGVVLDDVPSGRHVHAEHRRIGVVFQDHRVFGHLSALENVAFARRAAGLPGSLARGEALRWLGEVGLAGAAHLRASRLSGGQRQRVALARALAAAPCALLLDEPFTALDTRTRGPLRTLVRRHVRDRLVPVVLVTHDAADADALADRVVTLHDGRVRPT